MQGIGEIRRANAQAGDKFGGVGADGEGTPWIILRRPDNTIAPWAVIRRGDGIIVGEHAKISQARKQVARLIRAA
jgi:hypothetical protein